MKKYWPILLGILVSLIIITAFAAPSVPKLLAEIDFSTFQNPSGDNVEIDPNGVYNVHNLVIPPGTGDTFNPTTCEFQSPLPSRKPSLEGIVWVASNPDPSKGKNYSWDNYYFGLHRNTMTGWPGVDFTVPTTVPFKNGAIVDMVGYDTEGTGGNSLYLKGIGVCEGWYAYIGHLNYDPTTKYMPGDFIDPDTIVGIPGCSGYEDKCWSEYKAIYGDDWSKMPTDKISAPINHYSIGYKDNVFNFGDGTEIVYQGGYYWIHIARTENTNLNYQLINQLGPYAPK